MITKLAVGNLYEINGKYFILCASEFKHGKHDTPIVKYYFKKPTFEDGKAYALSKFIEERKNEY
jgi:hypothetical protein